MSYFAKGLKALAAGSGKAPAIYTYKTDDLIVDITTLGYFDDNGGSGIFEPNDIIYVSANGGFAKIICVQNDRDAAQGSKLNFSSYTTFVGDVRATDEAGYLSDNFGVGMGSAQGVFMQHTYRNNTDSLALIAAADYFLTAGVFLQVGDVIEVVAVDGLQMLMVTATGLTTVTTRVITFI